MIIPKLHYISQGDSPKKLLENIQKACTSGIELIQLHLNDISGKKILKLAEESREITSHYQTRLIITDHYKIAKEVKADGVFLGKTDCSPSIARKHLYTWQIMGGTANTLQDCEALIVHEVHYISLGPFRATISKDDLNPILGLNGYTAITEALRTETPIIGMGGITTGDVRDLLKAGVSGVAVSEEITNNFNAIRTFSQLLNAPSTEEQRYTFN